MKRSFIPLLILLGACHPAPPTVRPAPVLPEAASADSAPRFFHDSPYGTDAQFNPLLVFANQAFDQQRTSKRRDITTYPFGASFGAVWRTVTRPDKSIKHYGVENWLKNEIFPLTLRGSGGGQWYPNYTLHLFGCGVAYRRLVDWYRDHGVEGHPELAAGITTYAYHFLNEALENGPTADQGVDALSDLLVFDAASIALWNQRWVQHLFTGPIEVNTWYGQPSVGLPGRTIENAFALFVARAAVPHTTNWKVTVTHGYLFSVGVSRRIGSRDWLTLASGADAPVNPVIDTVTGKKTATLEPNAAVFYDRDGSLLASLVTRGGSDNGVTLNVYPGFVRIGWFKPSFWIQQNKGGGARFGISSNIGFGISTHSHIPR